MRRRTAVGRHRGLARASPRPPTVVVCPVGVGGRAAVHYQMGGQRKKRAAGKQKRKPAAAGGGGAAAPSAAAEREGDDREEEGAESDCGSAITDEDSRGSPGRNAASFSPGLAPLRSASSTASDVSDLQPLSPSTLGFPRMSFGEGSETDNEILALEAIYGSDFTVLPDKRAVVVQISPHDSAVAAVLHIALPPDYPASPPVVEVEPAGEALGAEQAIGLAAEMNAEAARLCAEGREHMLYEMCWHCHEALELLEPSPPPAGADVTAGAAAAGGGAHAAAALCAEHCDALAADMSVGLLSRQQLLAAVGGLAEQLLGPLVQQAGPSVARLLRARFTAVGWREGIGAGAAGKFVYPARCPAAADTLGWLHDLADEIRRVATEGPAAGES